MRAIASQITSPTIVYSTLYSRGRSKKTSKLRVTGLCEINLPVTGEFPAQMASNTENVSIWKAENCHDVNFIVTDATGVSVCLNDNSSITRRHDNSRA